MGKEKGLYEIRCPYGEKRYVVASSHKEVDKYIEETKLKFNSYTCVASNDADGIRNHRELVLL